MISGLAILLSPAGALAPLQRYAGHCWIATIAPATTDRHCFERVYGGAHVRDRHVVERAGEAVYAGETLYSAEAGRLVLTYWNSLGGVGRGTAVARGDTVRFTLSMRATPDAAALTAETIWQRTATGYDAATGDDVRHFTLDDRSGR